MSGRLAAATRDRLVPAVARPGYDRDAQAIGIVHLGLGAFARAHQAVYADDAMAAGDRGWAIAGVSLRSTAVRDALASQDGLYTVTERGGASERIRLIGALREMVVAPKRPGHPAMLIALPSVHVITLTVTEKGYCRGSDGGLDDAAVARSQGTIHHVLAAGLAARRAAGLGGVTLVSCDNLSGNGAVLARTLGDWLARTDPALARWVAAECTFPSTMVDRIVPAATPADLDRVERAIGLRDEAAVVTEPFRQWVIEDRFAGPRPRWEAGGAEIVADVAPFETAKLRLLNGAHSALAYLGLTAGHRFVHQAIADPAIGATIDRLMRDEAAATVATAPGQDLSRYADTLRTRFANAALPHRLAQIATDGSQKIGQRWLTPLAINAMQGRRCPATLRALAAWMRHVRGNGIPVDDPLAERLCSCWRAAGDAGIVEALFGPHGLIAGDWRPDAADRQTLEAALRQT